MKTRTWRPSDRSRRGFLGAENITWLQVPFALHSLLSFSSAGALVVWHRKAWREIRIVELASVQVNIDRTFFFVYLSCVCATRSERRDGRVSSETPETPQWDRLAARVKWAPSGKCSRVAVVKGRGWGEGVPRCYTGDIWPVRDASTCIAARRSDRDSL